MAAGTLHRLSFWKVTIGASAGLVCIGANIEISLYGRAAEIRNAVSTVIVGGAAALRSAQVEP